MQCIVRLRVNVCVWLLAASRARSCARRAQPCTPSSRRPCRIPYPCVSCHSISLPAPPPLALIILSDVNTVSAEHFVHEDGTAYTITRHVLDLCEDSYANVAGSRLTEMLRDAGARHPLEFPYASPPSLSAFPILRSHRCGFGPSGQT